jgi:hypothetical protein
MFNKIYLHNTINNLVYCKNFIEEAQIWQKLII